MIEDAGLIDSLRRHPIHCVYCNGAAISREHALPKALGGRLWAPVLCADHNALVARRSDEPMIEQFKPFVNALAIRRHDGSVGVPFKAVTGEGREATVSVDGKIILAGLDDQVRDANNKIVRASGDLALLEKLQADGAFADPTNQRIIATVSMPPPVNFAVEVAKAAECGVLKAAYHFVAGFVCDVDAEVAISLLSHIIGDKVAGGDFVRTWAYDDSLFPGSWPPRHELTSYPAGGHTFVTVSLFCLYPFIVRLPVETYRPLRYEQSLIGGTHPKLYAPHVAPEIDWERPLAVSDKLAFKAEYSRRLDAVTEFGAHRVMRRICKDAAEAATRPEARAAVRTDFFARYRAELQLKCLDEATIDILVSRGRALADQGKRVWQF